MPETIPSSASNEMDVVLNYKLAQFSSKLRADHRAGVSLDDLRKEKEAMLSEIYKVLTICLGKPVDTFTYEWKATPEPKKDEEKKDVEKKEEPKEKWESFTGTPKEFYDKFIGLDLDEYIVLTHAPARGFEEGKNYAVEYALNVVGTPLHSFVTVSLETLKKAAIDSIKDDQAMWFDCDVTALSMRKEGFLDDKVLDLTDLFQSDFEFDKGESLIFRNTAANHAMTLVGVNLVDGKPNRWKVENSWGKDVGDGGIFVMSDSWFDKFVYGLVVNKKYLPEEVVEASKQEPIMLPAWSVVSKIK